MPGPGTVPGMMANVLPSTRAQDHAVFQDIRGGLHATAPLARFV